MTEEEMRSVLKGVEQFLSGFDDVGSSAMSLTQLRLFLAVAANEGQSGIELSTRVKVPRATATRHLLDLSDKLRSGDKGYGLILRDTDPQNLKTNRYYLSPKGKRFLMERTERLLPLVS